MRDFHFPSRSTVHARHGMVATSHPLASLAAIDMLQNGGTAADAAVAAAALLAVVEPMSTGVGGDAFCLVSHRGSAELSGYNGSGRAPKALSLDRFKTSGWRQIPLESVHSVTIPGAVDLWLALLERYGRLDRARVLAPAIDAAVNGFALTPRIQHEWTWLSPKLQSGANAPRHFLVDGHAPELGSVFRQPALGTVLQAIAERGRSGFYEGRIAEDMVTTLKALGGVHELDDFAQHRGEWVTPIQSTYRGVDVFEIPPNGQGITTLLMLNILETFELSALDPDGAERLHLEVEASKLAYLQRDRFIADPKWAQVPTDRLLDKGFAAELARSIDRKYAGGVPAVTDPHRDTTYIAVGDAEGTMISFINSLFYGFGSGIASEKSGIMFQNRGAGFVLDAAHPNRLEGGKRPLHTIIPAFANLDGRPWMSFGVMGGDYQPVGQSHVLSNILDYGMDAQQALDSPRAFHMNGKLYVERGLPPKARQGLADMGHDVADIFLPWGGGQIVMRDQTHGTWIGASEPRKDGIALGY